MAAPIRIVIGLLAVSSLSGCLHDVGQPQEVWVLDYTLRSAPGAGPQAGGGGAHCATAWMGGGFLSVQHSAYERTLPSEVLLFVRPELRGEWVVIGTEPYVRGIPHAFTVGENRTPWAQVDIVDGSPMIDGESVSLPHQWTVEAEDGSWSLVARLFEGPGRVKVVDDRVCM